MFLFDRYKAVVALVWPFFLVALGGGRFADARMSADDRGSMALESRDDDDRGQQRRNFRVG